MAKTKKVPELRFGVFTKEWLEKEYSDIAKVRRGLTYHPCNVEVDGIRVLRSSNIDEDTFIQKQDDIFVNEKAINIDFVKNNDILITSANGSSRLVGKHAIITNISGKVVHGGFMLLATAKYPYFVNASMSSRWYGEFINLYVAGGNGAIGNLNRTDLERQNLFIPEELEQIKVGTFFLKLDALIALHQRKHDKLRAVKKSMLEKMFPKEGADVPEIRFKGFTGKWERKKLVDITTPFANPIPTPHDGYWRLGIRSHARGTFYDYVMPGKELETAQMHEVDANNLIVNITFAWEHAVAITDSKDAGKLVSHRFPQFSFNIGMVPGYFKFLIIDDRFKHHLWLSSPGGAGRNRVLKIKEMLEYSFGVPNSSEQSRIASFFQHLDSLIALHQQELYKLKNIKKACLEKMFV